MTEKKKKSDHKITSTKLAQLEAELEQERERTKRVAADYANLERRIQEERIQLRRQASKHLLEQLFPIFDNFARASKHAPNVTLEDLPHLKEEDFSRIFKYFAGLRMIESQMEQVLGEAGLKKITTKGELFDPEKHEAISYENNTDIPVDHIIDEVETGWVLGDDVIKPAKVRVSKG